MKKLLILFFFFCLALHTSAQITFQKAYGTSTVTIEELKDCILTVDGGIMLAGTSRTLGPGTEVTYLVKTNFAGEVQWSETIGTNLEKCIAISAVMDGGYIITGTKPDGSGQNRDVILIRTDSMGIVQWSRSYAITGDDVPCGIHQAFDGGYIINGSTQQFVLSSFLLKTDSTGLLQWCKVLPVESANTQNSCTVNFNGNYVMMGSTTSINGDEDLFITEINPSGSVLWFKIYDTGLNDNAAAINHTFDNGYIAAGTIIASGTNGDAFLLKIDSAGTIQWSYKYVHCISPIYVKSVEQTFDLGYIVSGKSSCSGLGAHAACIFKTDISGISQWTEYYGTPTGFFEAVSCHQVFSDGSFITGLQSYGQWEYSLVKSDGNGVSGCNELNAIITTTPVSFADSSVLVSVINSGSSAVLALSAAPAIADSLIYCMATSVQQEFSLSAGLSVKPNPSQGNFEIQWDKSIADGRLIIFNVIGEKVFEEPVFNESKKEFRVNSICSGMYLVKLISGEKHYSGRIIIIQ